MKRHIIILLALLFTSSQLWAQQMKAEADSAYINKEYAKAIEIYESMLQQGESGEVYYNLGNAYFKQDELGKAILNYERALLLQPGNSDINANLDMARAKTVDKVNPNPEVFFDTHTHQYSLSRHLGLVGHSLFYHHARFFRRLFLYQAHRIAKDWFLCSYHLSDSVHYM